MSMLSGLALAIAVTKAGKHVVAEKPWPCGRTLTMIEACDAAGVKLIVKQNWFNVPVVNEALDVARLGAWFWALRRSLVPGSVILRPRCLAQYLGV